MSEFAFDFKLGEKVKDRITGFKGIIQSRAEFLTGCRRYGIQSEKLNKDGLPGDAIFFDEDSLISLAKPKHKKNAQRRGGGTNPPSRLNKL